MKITYKLLSMFLGLSLLGCNESTPPDPVKKESATKKNSSGKVFESKLPDTAPVLKVAAASALPPFSFGDENGKLQGIDIDIIRAIGEKEGFKVELYADNWNNLSNSLENGTRDLAISGIAYTDKRAKKYAVSDSYFFSPSAIMYHDTSLKIDDLADLDVFRVASLVGSRQLEELKSLSNHKKLIEDDTIFLLYQELLQGKADAIVYNKPTLDYEAAIHPDYTVKVVTIEDESSLESQTVIMMDKENKALLKKINSGISELKASGEIKRISEKWLHLPVK